MKTLLLAASILLATLPAFAKPAVHTLCHSLKGAAKAVSLLTIETVTGGELPLARVSIDKKVGEISQNVPSNDETFGFSNDPINGQFSADGDITSDDPRYTSITYSQIPGTVQISKNSTANKGAADFRIKLTSSLHTLSGASAETKDQELLCHAEWSSAK
jgi:hypothetical protein